MSESEQSPAPPVPRDRQLSDTDLLDQIRADEAWPSCAAGIIG
jgi:hypothetical protein